MIRIDQIWLGTEPVDMRAGMDTLLSRVVMVFGAAQPHHAYLFTNRRANRMKVLVHDSIGIWLATRRLHKGSFTWSPANTLNPELTEEQWQALIIGLPWHRIGTGGVIGIL